MIIRKKLIEVSIPLEEINLASAKEKSIRQGHPLGTLADDTFSYYSNKIKSN